MPSLWTEGKVWKEPQRHQWLSGPVQNKGSWSNTPQCAADGRQDMVAILTPRGRSRLPFIGGNWRQIDSVSRETSSWGTSLTAPQVNDYHKGRLFPFNKLAGGAILAWGLEQSLGAQVIGCRRSRAWSIWECRESKRAAILSGLTTHPSPTYPAQPLQFFGQPLSLEISWRSGVQRCTATRAQKCKPDTSTNEDQE